MRGFMYIRNTKDWTEKLVGGVYEEVWFGLLEMTKKLDGRKGIFTTERFIGTYRKQDSS